MPIENPFRVPLRLQARGGKKGVRRCRDLRIPVSICFLKESAILLADIGDFAFLCGNGEASLCFCRQAARMNACIFETSGKDRFDAITCFKWVGEVSRF